ncbi:MAG: RNA methyltransferase [Alphaproteobacteria bacterium]|jgi:tRNA/rRNA methyltransferase
MAGTDRSRDAAALGGPTIILVRPQLGENIGTAARAMQNFGLTDLRLVSPRDGWPNVKAVNAASRATEVLDAVRLYDSTAEAVADLQHVYATTARSRFMLKPVATPRNAANDMRSWMAAGEPCGVLFGPERMGLHNDDVALADAVLSVPLNPAFASLNLAQAVLLVGYEWFQADVPPTDEDILEPNRTPPATREKLENFFGHLERELDACGFLYPPEKRPNMVRNIRNLFLRAKLHEQEVSTLHGIVSELVKGHEKDR